MSWKLRFVYGGLHRDLCSAIVRFIGEQKCALRTLVPGLEELFLFGSCYGASHSYRGSRETSLADKG